MGDRKPVMSIDDENTVMIHAASKNKNAAAEFVNFMVSPETSAEKLEIDKPYASSDLDRPFPALADGAAPGQGDGRRRLLHVHARRPRTPPAISDRFLDGLQGVLAGAIAPDEAMQATEMEAQRVRGDLGSPTRRLKHDAFGTDRHCEEQ